MGVRIGLDFGTSNSTVAVMDRGAPRLLALEGTHATLPSAIFFDFESGTDHYGRDAIALYTDGHQGRLMRSLKSVLGTGLMAESTRIRARQVAFEDVLGAFIRHVKVTAERQLGETVTDVVLGRPVHFVDDDAEADRLAEATLERIARKQGFKSVRFQLEPIAAALDYERSLTRERLAMIADIGGGTADFTVARLGPGRGKYEANRVLANGGVHVGGTDMDRRLSVSQVMPLFGLGTKSKDGKRDLPVWPFQDMATWHRINSLSDPKALAQLRSILKDSQRPDLFGQLLGVVEHRDGHRLAGQVEVAKVALSDHEFHRAEVAGLDCAVLFSRAGFEDSVAPLVDRLKISCLETLAAADVEAGKIDAVFLTGGTTQIPVVRAMLDSIFADSQFVQGDVFGSVGLGLAIEAERVFGQSVR